MIGRPISSGVNNKRFGIGSMRRAQGANSTPAPIPTVAITKTSASGATLAFSVDSIGYVVGYYWNLQIAGNSGFTTAYPGEAAIRDEIRMVTLSDLTDDDNDGTAELDAFSALVGQKSGLAYLRIRLGRDSNDGLGIDWGAWSNTISDTVSLLSPSTMDPAAKSNFVALSNGNLTVTSGLFGVNALSRARSTQSRNFHSHFEVTATTVRNSGQPMAIGVCTSGVDMGGYGANVTGFSGVVANGASGDLYADGAFVGNSASYAFASGDVLTIDCDPATNTLKICKNGGGWFTMALPTSTEDFYVCIMANPQDAPATQNVATVNFGATAFLVAPSGGASAFT